MLEQCTYVVISKIVVQRYQAYIQVAGTGDFRFLCIGPVREIFSGSMIC